MKSFTCRPVSRSKTRPPRRDSTKFTTDWFVSWSRVAFASWRYSPVMIGRSSTAYRVR